MYLTKHLKYIGFRLQLLAPHISDTVHGTSTPPVDQKITLGDLAAFLVADSPMPHELPQEAQEAADELRRLIRQWDILSDGDIAGYIYQQLRSNSHKKSQGQYFTPRDVVEHLVANALDDIDLHAGFRVLDPACGSGQFLIAACRYLLHRYLEEGYSRELAMRRIIELHLYGIDRDPLAVSICRFNLAKISGCTIDKINIYNNDYLCTETGEYPDSPVHKKYSLIIGNPPWGSQLGEHEKRRAKARFESAKSGINTFTLFIERSVELLSDGGRLAFLVPEAYLNIKAHAASRLHLLATTRLTDIALWGEKFKGVFAPSASFIAVREPEKSLRTRSIIRIRNISPGRKAATATLVPQSYYHGTPHNIFNVKYTRRAVSLISRIEDQDCISLRDRARFFLGIVTGSNPSHLKNHSAPSHPDPILIGSDISQYHIDFSGHYFRFDPGVLQQVAPMELYRTRNKLLYRFIGKRLVFALDREGFFSLNNVNGLIPAGVDMEPECLMALLNSRVLQYYYETNFFTVKVLRGNLEQLPLKVLSKESRKRLLPLAMELMESGRPAHSSPQREAIEDIIFHEYGISDREACSMMEEHWSEGHGPDGREITEA